ncbi:MAG: AI-2E family transporter [Eubacteriales bacterium]
MDKEKLKKGLNISLIIFIGLALAITYFFLIFSSDSIGSTISKISVILRPIIVGAVIAYILKSTCNGYEKLFVKLFAKRKKPNPQKDAKRANLIAVTLTYITWVAVITALLWVAIPQVIESISAFIQDLINDMPMYIETATAWINDFKAQYPDIAPFVDQAGDFVVNWLKNDLVPQLPTIGGNIVIGAVEFVNVLKDVAIGLVISAFFLSGRKVFAKKSKFLLHTVFKEKHANAIISEARFADRMFGGFLEGKIIDSTLIGIIYFIALVLMDIKYAALLALICGVTNIIPFFGPFIGAVPSGLIILMSNEHPLPKLLYFIIFVCVIQFIDGNIIDPHIVGGNIKMSPFCVIFSVLFFGGLWGFTGLLVGVPTFAVIYDICKKIVYNRLRKTGKKHILKAHLQEFGNAKEKAAAAAEDAPVTEGVSVAENPKDAQDNLPENVDENSNENSSENK